MQTLKEGSRLADRYTLVRRLGGGGMSEVWLARDGHSRSRVALKFLAPELARHEARRTLFHQEWQTGSRLMHAHIARVFEYHDDPDRPYYSQQFIDGPDLSAVTGQPVEDALRPFGLIADALRYAHGKNVIHRDVKAANVLLDGRGTPYLVDFGVSRSAEAAASGGTPVSSSPQQRAGQPAAAPDDVYALGVLMHEVLTGAPPASDDKARGVPATAVDGGPVPEPVQRLIGEMLATEAERRPRAEEVADRLREAGISPGPARLPTKELALEPRDEETAETLSSIRPVRSVAGDSQAPDPARAPSRGVPAAVAWGGLAVLLAVFLSVIFWLPGAIEQDSREDGAPSADAAIEGGPARDETLADPAAREAAEPAVPVAELKAAADEALGRLLSRLDRLESRGIERWGGRAYEDMLAVYEQGDSAYLDKDFAMAAQHYRDAADRLEPFFDRVDDVFAETLAAAREAFAARDHVEAVRLYELAVAITPGHREAREGLARAKNLEAVLSLTEQAAGFERDLELQAAKLSFEKALELDPAWQPAADGLQRVIAAIRQRSFEQRMTEGYDALAAGQLQTARAAFDAAKRLRPESREPVDGLLQVDQEVRLAEIRRLEQEARALEQNEEWGAAIARYEEIAEIDSDLQFVREGLARARERAAIHDRLDTFIDNPDSLSDPATMQSATRLLLQVTTMDPTGPRLEDRKDELSRLLKRAATPLTVQLVSDNATEVSIFRVGKLGTFTEQELTLRPGAYVAMGSRPGYRDVRLEFRVAPEMDQEPVVIKCEEPI